MKKIDIGIFNIYDLEVVWWTPEYHWGYDTIYWDGQHHWYNFKLFCVC